MEKAVIISIKGKQEFENVPADSMELLTQGTLECDNGMLSLSYQESEVTGMEGTLTTIHVEEDGERVTLMRFGGYNSQMVFEEGRRHLSMYNTPYGSMAVGVNTRHLLADLDERGGVIEIDYTIEIEHAIVGRNVFRIEVKEASGNGSLKQ